MRFGPAYSPWSNRLNERNHTKAVVTIRKMMEDKKTPLMIDRVKAAAWTHNTSANKLGFLPLHLVTGKAILLPRLTTRNEVSESMTYSEAAQRKMETLTKIISKLQ